MNAETPLPLAGPSAPLSLTDEMAAKYLHRVQQHAARLARRARSRVPVGDLVSAGCVGLLDAFLKFDKVHAAAIDEYVEQRIRGAMLDELRRRDPLTRDLRAFGRKLELTRQSFAVHHGREPDERELIAEMRMTPESYHWHLARLPSPRRCVTSQPFVEEDNAADEHADEGQSDDVPDALISTKQLTERLRSEIGRLDPRQQQLLRLYYEEELTFREIGVALGLTYRRAAQIHLEALTRLREMLPDEP